MDFVFLSTTVLLGIACAGFSRLARVLKSGQ